MTHIIGVDLSTKGVWLAAVPLHEPAILGRTIQLTQAEIRQPKRGEHVDPAERSIRAGQAARECIRTLHARGIDIHSICVEHPGGKHVHPSLWQAFGAICHALDEYPVGSLKAAEWRRGIGCEGRAVNSKDDGNDRVLVLTAPLISGGPADFAPYDFTADMLDSIGIALAHRNAVLKMEEAA